MLAWTALIDAGIVLAGNLDGEADADTLRVATDNAAATLSGADSDGFGGTITGVSGTFDGMNTLNATGTMTEVLNGADLLSVWDWTADTVLTNGQTLTHTGFDTLNGGSAMDTFNLSDNAAVDINGGGGDDKLSITADGKALTGTRRRRWHGHVGLERLCGDRHHDHADRSWCDRWLRWYEYRDYDGHV